MLVILTTVIGYCGLRMVKSKMWLGGRASSPSLNKRIVKILAIIL